MKRRQVIQKLKRKARTEGLEFEVIELTRHTAVRVGSTTKTIGRHSEIPDMTAVKFFEQYSQELGMGWWR